MYLISDHNVSDLCGREEILDIGLDPSESDRRTACERNDFIIWDSNDDGNTRVCKRTEHRRIRIINLHVLDAKCLHQVCHHRRLRQVIRHKTIVHSDRSFHCMVCTNLLCSRRPSTQPIRKELTIFITKIITKKTHNFHQKLISSIQQHVHTDCAMEAHEEVPKHQTSNAILQHQRD